MKKIHNNALQVVDSANPDHPIKQIHFFYNGANYYYVLVEKNPHFEQIHSDFKAFLKRPIQATQSLVESPKFQYILKQVRFLMALMLYGATLGLFIFYIKNAYTLSTVKNNPYTHYCKTGIDTFIPASSSRCNGKKLFPFSTALFYTICLIQSGIQTVRIIDNNLVSIATPMQQFIVFPFLCLLALTLPVYLIHKFIQKIL